MSLITHETLLRKLVYDPETGIFNWNNSKKMKNKPLNKTLQVNLEGRNYSLNRLAWFYVYKKWPTTHTLKHLNGDKFDNAISNLKEFVPVKSSPKNRKKAKIYDRVITSADIMKYEGSVVQIIFKYICKCFNGIHVREQFLDCSLGNTAYTLNDVKQLLYLEVFYSLQRFNPNHKTEEGLSIKESTFVIGHLHRRAKGLAKKLTLKKNYYGIDFIELSSIDSPQKYYKD